jgi:hypothetical protein
VVVGALVTLVGGAFFLHAASRQEHAAAARELEAAADHKATEILRWLDVHGRALTALGSASPFASAANAIASGSATSADEALVEGFLASFRVQYGCDDIWIADVEGRPVFAPYSTDLSISPALREAIERASESRDVVFSDIYSPAPGEPPRVDFVAPLPAQAAESPAALLVASVHADKFLYPLIAKWPTASGSADTLLLERDGDAARILTPLRHASDPPLAVSADRASGSVEAVAVWGEGGVLEGRDYRGVRVIAYARELAGTPWVLLAKVDRSEVMAAWRSEEAAALIVIALVELTIVGGSVGLWSRWVAERRKEDAQRLATVLDALRSTPDSAHDLLARLLRAVMDATVSPAGAVYRYDAERSLIRPEVRLSDSIIQPGPPHVRSFDWIPATEAGAWAEPLVTGKPLIVNSDVEHLLEERGHRRHPLPLSTFLAVPVIVDGTPVAVAGLANRASGYDERDAAELALCSRPRGTRSNGCKPSRSWRRSTRTSSGASRSAPRSCRQPTRSCRRSQRSWPPRTRSSRQQTKSCSPRPRSSMPRTSSWNRKPSSSQSKRGSWSSAPRSLLRRTRPRPASCAR